MLGGYPTPLDVGYPFEYPAPFFGQPGAGSPFHCPIDAPADINIDECPRVVTSSDEDSEGPGHLPPEAVTSAMVHAHMSCAIGNEGWFDHGCRAPADALLRHVRTLFPREQYPDHSHYPPPTTPGSYLYLVDEFRSPEGSPHWCDEEYTVWRDFCPYHRNGQYVHAHLIFAALQQHLAAQYNPAQCGQAWDDSHYPSQPDSSIAFPRMVQVGNLSKPALPYEWPGSEGRLRKAVRAQFVTRLVMGTGAAVA